ncbi:hypothetical protein LTR50_004598 [Elasticomyces elasticus]|nr:hypothetical protein LTR50_004598 [Elasticomyces elasticus]
MKRSPLAPPAVTPPSLSRQTSYNAARQECSKPAPAKATTLLAKVASGPTSQRRTSPDRSLLPSPSAPTPAPDEEVVWNAARQQSADSEPDFECFQQTCEPNGNREQRQGKNPLKAG